MHFLISFHAAEEEELHLLASLQSLIFTCLIWQVMVTNVTSLLKTVKAVEDEATRGTRALEATIECIKQELTVRVAHRSNHFSLRLLGVKWWETPSLQHGLKDGQEYLCLLFGAKPGSFLFFCPLLPAKRLSSQILQVSHSSYQLLGNKHRQRENGKRES